MKKAAENNKTMIKVVPSVRRLAYSGLVFIAKRRR